MADFSNPAVSQFVKLGACAAKVLPNPDGLSHEKNFILFWEWLCEQLEAITGADTPQIEGLNLVQYVDNTGAVTGYAAIILDENTNTTSTQYFDAALNPSGPPAGAPAPELEYEYKWVETCLRDDGDGAIYKRLDCIALLNGVQQGIVTYWRDASFNLTTTAPTPVGNLVECGSEQRERVGEATYAIDDTTPIMLAPPAGATHAEIFPSIEIAWDHAQAPVVGGMTVGGNGIPNNAYSRIEIENANDLTSWQAIALGAGSSGILRVFYYVAPSGTND